MEEKDLLEEVEAAQSTEQESVHKLMDINKDEKELKGFAKVKENITHGVRSLLNKISSFLNNNKAGRVIKTIFKYIGLFFYYLAYPFVLFKRKCYDKWTSKGQKLFVSILFLTPVILGFLVFYLYPMIMSLIYSFSGVVADNGVIVHFGKFIHPENRNELISDFFGNYKYAFTELMFPARGADFGSDEKISFIQALTETGFQTILDAIVITIFSLLIAVMLNGNFKGRAVARAIFFLPVILNSEAITAATESTAAIDSVLNSIGQNALSQIFDMKKFFTQIGIPAKIVTFLSDITSTIYSTISYAGVQILIFLAAIQSVPGHLYEAAKIEGATKYESFWKITLPMVSPMILTVVVYTIVDSFLRSDLSFYLKSLNENYKYGLHAAVSWCYILLSLLILGIALIFLKKVVFYHDERK
jgi:ABC-type sugar transport system permease subunit